MVRKFRAVLVLMLAFSLLLPTANVTYAQPQPQDGTPVIRLKSGTIVPGEAVRAAGNLTIDGYQAGQEGYYIVQFVDAVQPQWADGLAASGADVLDYLPDYAFKTRMTPEEAAQIAQEDDVNWVGIFQPAYKLAPDLASGNALFKLRVEQDADAQQVSEAVAATGATVVSQDGPYITFGANESQIVAVANILDVAWIENFVLYEKHNEYGAGAIVHSNVANANGYDGSTQIAAVADTGLGGGTAATAHADLPSSRIVAIQNFSAADSSSCYDVIPDGAQDVDSGHGTHVALSVVGGGGAGGLGKGTAPEARLVFQAIEEFIDFVGFCSFQYADGYYLLGIPTNLNNLFQPAYNAGARIHSKFMGIRRCR